MLAKAKMGSGEDSSTTEQPQPYGELVIIWYILTHLLAIHTMSHLRSIYYECMIFCL